MLVGPSGCGKTTLISIVAAILNQDSGKCEVLGRDLQHMGQTERARLRRNDRLRGRLIASSLAFKLARLSTKA